MGRFVSVTAQLYQEVELLAELEQSLRRMQVQSSVDSSGVKLFEFQQKITRQRKEVKRLREMSPWVRTYDYTVRLLLRSVFTIVGRINHVFGVKRLASVEAYSNSAHINSECLLRSYSVSARMHTIVHPFENMPPRFHSRSLGSSISNWELSGNEIRSKNKPPLSKTRAPFTGCLMAGNESPLPQSCMQMRCGSQRSTYAFSNGIDKTKDRYAIPLSRSNLIHTKLSLFISNRNLLNAPPATLGAAALALHYANVIILIEKIALSHHSVFLDARDDLYDMLPTNIRISMRAKLKLFAKTAASSVYDAALAAKMSSTLGRILEWLAPLAHNMIRWHSERNFRAAAYSSRNKCASGPDPTLCKSSKDRGCNHRTAYGSELRVEISQLLSKGDLTATSSACTVFRSKPVFCCDLLLSSIGALVVSPFLWVGLNLSSNRLPRGQGPRKL
ncbi:hypothetical protein HYC85_021830 [Camellia sinensis]|uniref:DUF668 domain-containing protein n=1 Tax=Camellia sinensis TaxID=4442 RepID=A0A7J7GIP0_CAMSI|nr:hypothetical protein HYC85_021830 [Camellia sinensis]